MAYTTYNPQFANIQRPVLDLPVELINTVAQRKQQTYDTNLELTTKAEGMLNQIPTLPSDTPHFQEHISNFKRDLENLNQSYNNDYSNPEYGQKANLLINRYASDPKLKQWTNRYSSYLDYAKKKQEDPYGLWDMNPDWYKNPLYSKDDDGNYQLSGQMSGNLVKDLTSDLYEQLNKDLALVKENLSTTSPEIAKLGNHELLAYATTKEVKNSTLQKAANNSIKKILNLPSGRQLLDKLYIKYGRIPTKEETDKELLNIITPEVSKYEHYSKENHYSLIPEKSKRGRTSEGYYDEEGNLIEEGENYYLPYSATDTGIKLQNEFLDNLLSNATSEYVTLGFNKTKQKTNAYGIVVDDEGNMIGSKNYKGPSPDVYGAANKERAVNLSSLSGQQYQRLVNTYEAAIKADPNNKSLQETYSKIINKQISHLSVDKIQELKDLTDKYAGTVNASISYYRPAELNDPKALKYESTKYFGPSFDKGTVKYKDLIGQLSKYNIIDENGTLMTLKDLNDAANPEKKTITTDTEIPVSLEGNINPESLTKEVFSKGPQFANGKVINIKGKKFIVANPNTSTYTKKELDKQNVAAISSALTGNTFGESTNITHNGPGTNMQITPLGDTTKVTLPGGNIYDFKGDNFTLLTYPDGHYIIGNSNNPDIIKQSQLKGVKVNSNLPKTQAINILYGIFLDANSIKQNVNKYVTVQ